MHDKCRLPPACFEFFPRNHNISDHIVPVGGNHNIFAGLTLTRQRHAKVEKGRRHTLSQGARKCVRASENWSHATEFRL